MKVGMPIVSLHKVAREQHRIILEDDHGTIIHKPSGEQDPLLVRNGVYFMKMIVKHNLLRPPSESGFARQGQY